MTDRDDNLPEALTSMLLDATSAVEPDAATAKRMRASVLSRVREGGDEAAEALVTIPGRSDDWIETSPGNSIKILRSDDETMSMLVRLQPGTTFPQHYHPADEETFVVEGETWFGDIHLVAGDYHLAPKGTTHGEVRTDTGCVLLIRKAAD